MAAFGLVLAIMGYRQLANRSPQLILTNEGVTTSKGEHYRWSEITDEDTKVVRHGKSSSTYLTFYIGGEKRSIEINEYDVSATKLDRLLRVYRGRHENKIRTTERIF
ncbi:hypothetical protein DYU05_15015 [Mucilaginibacter terrenus]|uniref:Uncharacterized protein n=1 Tax=Mucilaginibacter terrenus TaxID=2482727 RepID=A0A3E2NRD2_9SPHI|nr:hypothetical protein [Mucilaginibacter terrenus]RFZ83440.1 hypothetical protein DYU05_15015 [Mucilaginibacter terrenus]